jgi:hypothetical protein
MPAESNPLAYRSKGDAADDDVQTMHRSLRTWVLLCVVWGVGLVVWAGYLALVAFLVLRLLV